MEQKGDNGEELDFKEHRSVLADYLDSLLVAVAWAHVLLAPYTKVEESFNLHAMHDVLMYGIQPSALQKFDHFVFPGAVPRTFIGSTAVAWLATPFLWFATAFGIIRTKLHVQIALRLVLATLNAIGLSLIRRATSRKYGHLAGVFFTLLTCSQFHLPFWMGRTVPNTYALFLANLSTYLFMGQPMRGALPIPPVALLIFSAVVFRVELAAFLAPVILQLLFKALPVAVTECKKFLAGCVFAGLLSILATVLVDSYFWDQPYLWPEFSAVFFNVFEGKSADWGVSPPLTYFTSFLPKLLLSVLPLSLVALYKDRGTLSLLFPSWMFITLISFLGHKEWRFIIYVVPIFNVAAARRCSKMVSESKGTWRRRILIATVAACLLINVAFTSLTTYASIANYSGGEALERFHARYPPSTPVHLHISNLAAQTGASLFLHENAPPHWRNHQVHSHWLYNKTEGLTLQDVMSPESPFSHLIVEEEPLPHPLWRVVDSTQAFDGIRVNPGAVLRDGGLVRRVKNALQIKRREKLWTLERVH